MKVRRSYRFRLYPTDEQVERLTAWENALKNYAPNLGYDLGGRLTAAWLDRA